MSLIRSSTNTTNAGHAKIDNFAGRPAGHLLLAGKSQNLATFEPKTSEISASAPMEAYRTAFAQLDSSDPAARQSLAALVADLPDDPLTLLHLQRALSGATDVIVDLSNKLPKGSKLAPV